MGMARVAVRLTASLTQQRATVSALLPELHAFAGLGEVESKSESESESVHHITCITSHHITLRMTLR